MSKSFLLGVAEAYEHHQRGLVARMQKNSERQIEAKGKGPRARVAKMAVDQRWNLEPRNKDKPRREIRPL